MVQTIEFTKTQNGRWEHTFKSTGPVVVQINTESAGCIYVFASYDGLTRSMVGEFTNPNASLMFGIDLPAGVEVTIWSVKRVTKAVMAEDEDA